MSTAIPADQLSLQAGAIWTRLLETADAVARALRGQRRLTEAQRRLYAVAEELGAHVLEAEDVADVRARLYEMAQGTRLLEWELKVLHEIDLGDLPAPDQAERSFAGLFGETRLAHECARLVAMRMALVARLLSSLRIPEGHPDGPATLAHAINDFRTPPVIRSLVLETLAGESALLALFAPLLDPGRWQCPPWMRLALLEQVRLASVSHLRLLSVIPALEIPEDVLPSDERLDPAALDAESRALASFTIPADLSVGSSFVETLLDEVEGDSPAPPGVQALFED